MKKVLFALIFALFSVSGYSQVATNFLANDCDGNPHNLFSELDSGKVIVLCWVMPCGGCVAGASSAYSAVQSFASSNPNTVYMYLCDDYANSSCSSLGGWAAGNTMTDAVLFSNSSIDMLDYGSAGMPKVVVLGRLDHKVFYNANNSAINSTSIQTAITTALTTTAIDPSNEIIASSNVYPNPAVHSSEIRFNLSKTTDVLVELISMNGQYLKLVYSGSLNPGDKQIKMDVSGLASGMYLLRISEDEKRNFLRLLVSH